MRRLRERPRPYRAGHRVALSLAETANILYLLDNREQFLQGIKDVIVREVKKVQRIRQGGK